MPGTEMQATYTDGVAASRTFTQCGNGLVDAPDSGNVAAVQWLPNVVEESPTGFYFYRACPSPTVPEDQDDRFDQFLAAASRRALRDVLRDDD